MSDLEMLKADGTWKKIGTVDPASIKDLGVFGEPADETPEPPVLTVIGPAPTQCRKPKHTPGPWQAIPGGADWQIVVAESGVEVARLQLPFKASAAREQADARLIAQAPTMLQDLTDAAAQLRKLGGEVNAALATRFEATIAAAVGGAE